MTQRLSTNSQSKRQKPEGRRTLQQTARVSVNCLKPTTLAPQVRSCHIIPYLSPGFQALFEHDLIYGARVVGFKQLSSSNTVSTAMATFCFNYTVGFPLFELCQLEERFCSTEKTQRLSTKSQAKRQEPEGRRTLQQTARVSFNCLKPTTLAPQVRSRPIIRYLSPGFQELFEHDLIYGARVVGFKQLSISNTVSTAMATFCFNYTVGFPLFELC